MSRRPPRLVVDDSPRLRLVLLGAALAVLSACAKQAPPPAATSAPPPAPVATAGLLKQGEDLFTQNCATCHMADGGGVPFLQPSIRDSAWISHPDPQLLLSLILRGSAVLGEAAQAYENDMAPQSHLSDPEIAALATYVRRRFAAAPVADPVTPAQVALARDRPGLP
jgi:mono/diheme cytochrome c family protein